jgi:hypothetical protein
MMPASLSADGRRYRLVSLWEIMKPFNVAGFLRHPGLLGALAMGHKVPGLPPPSAEDRKVFDFAIATMERDCTEVGLVVSVAAAKRLRDALANDDCTNEDIDRLAGELRTRIRDEMEGRCFLELNSQEADYYNDPRKGWGTVLARFPSSIGEVEEASKCFALGRYTACVFHCMRGIDPAIQAIAAALGVTGYKNSWDAYLRAMKVRIEKKWPDTAKRKSHRDNAARYSTLIVRIAALKDALRNPTMHKVERIYTEEWAREVMAATLGFMRDVSATHKERPTKAKEST